MKFPCYSLLLSAACVCAAVELRAQPANNAAFGSTVMVWSAHTTVRERIDAGVNERIELWNRTWIVSPTGQTYANTNNYGLNGAEGSSTTTVTLNEVGRWSYWLSDGGAIDSFNFGDSPSSWYMFPHNPPNGVGYGGAGTQLGSYIDVQPATTYLLTTSVTGSGSVSGGGSYSEGSTATVTASPSSGYSFAGWQGALSGSTNPASVTMDADKSVTAVFAPINNPPTVAWTSAPSSAASGQSYTMIAHGHDADGNLTLVNLWKNGVAFAFAGGGNGTDNDASNSTADTGPTTITFTAQAVDGAGAMSATISHTVTIAAANRTPTITWKTTPGTVASGQNYTISAHGHDADGNLTQVNVWKAGVGFAFGNGGDGTDADSGNATSDTGPTTITFTANAVDASGATAATITQTVTVSAANAAPTIAWNTTPGTVASGQSYTISAHGHDADGNLTQVNVWKAGVGFAYGNGGNGTDADSGNATSDTGPTTITFSANAVDASGATAATITQTVTVSAANAAPTIAWNTTPGTVASGQSYTISAHGHDTDGNLTQVNVWKAGVGFAFGNGGNGTDADSGNATSDTGPTTITFTANAVDSNGTASATISQTVSVAAPPAVSASISASPTSVTAPGSTTITWSSANATSSAVSGSGLSSTAASGSQTVTGLAAGTYTYTITAQGNGGPVTQSATVSVAAAASVSATITASPTTASAPGSTTISWSSANATSVVVTGNGLSSTTTSGSQTITGLVAGSYDYVITAQGPNGPATQTATFTVAAAASVSAAITASPTTASAPGSTTISWSSGNATSVAVTGKGLSSTTASGSQTITGLVSGSYDYVITAQGPNGPATQTATFTVAAAASVSATITASPTTASAPGSTTISWSSANATSVAVTGNGLSSTAASGSQTITGLVAGSYDYVITAQGPNGPATQTATVSVAAAASVSATITASPTTASAPGSTTISWSSANATSVVVTGNGLSSTAASDSQTITGLVAGSYDYVITAQGTNGPATQTATLTVTSAVSVSGSITASPATGTEPASTAIAWSTTNATSVSVSGPGLSSTAGTGSQNLTGFTAGTHTFTLTAQGPGGPITRTATFTVSAAVPTVSGSISASPTSATAPGATTISWSTANATSVLVSGPGIASAVASGTQNVTGLAVGTHTYTLTAQGNGGPITRTATFTVSSGAGVTGSISVSPTTMAWGGTATLTWSTANATSVSVTGYGITGSPYQTYSSLTVNVGGLNPGQTTWTLVADGPGGPITRTATITVTTSDGLYGSLTASPTVIYSNQSATLNWTTTGTSFRWVHGYTPGMNGVNVYPAGVTGSAAVSGLAPGNYRFTIEYGPGSSTTRMSFADLTVLGVGRTVTTSVAPAGAGAVSGSGTYAEGSTATLTAAPDATHVFTGWSGDLSSPTSPFTFTVGAQNYNVVANFALRTYAVTVSVSPAGTGSVSGAGSYSMGTTATLTATPDATHVFTGWSGDITSTANPVSFAVNNHALVTANFAASSFTLTTAAGAGGGVTPGGTYPAGTTVTISASADATHRFTGWSGDATGAVPTVAVTLDRAKFVQASFTGKTAQTITFDPPGDHGLTSPPFALTASATSGLPVSFSLLGGPAILTGDSVQVTGAGPVTLQANQPGDAFFLPATPANQTFNVISAATLKYRGQSRTLLRDGTTREAPPYVLEKP